MDTHSTSVMTRRCILPPAVMATWSLLEARGNTTFSTGMSHDGDHEEAYIAGCSV
jgi:hypothetical protein